MKSSFYIILRRLLSSLCGLAFALILMQAPLSAQNTTAAKHTVSGFIMDVVTNAVLPGAIVQIFNSHTKIIAGISTDSTGHFSMTINEAPFKINVRLLGYESVSIDSIKDTKENQSFTILLKSQFMKTKEVIVTAEKAFIEYYVDKQVINLRKMPGIEGNTVIEALEKSGIISVDPITKEVQFRGNKKIDLKIDDKVLPNLGDLIKQMPAAMVDKIEVISAPSAKYDAEGESGILNIILRHSLGDYFSGNFSVSASTQGSSSLNSCLNFKKDAFNFFALGWLSGYELSNSFHGSTTNQNSTAPFFGFSTSESKNYSHSRQGMAGFDWDINTNNFLSVSTSYGPGNSTGNSGSVSQYKYPWSSEENDMTSDRTITSNSTSRSWAGFYKIILDSLGGVCKNSIYYTDYESDGANNSGMINTFPGYTELRNTSTTTRTHTFYLNSDVEYPTINWGKFEGGYKYTSRERTDAYLDQVFDPATAIWSDTGHYSNTFTLKEGILAGYLSYGSKLSIIDYKVGLRTEHTQTEGLLETTGETFSNKYTDFFPSINLAYQYNPKNQFVLSYSRRISRPQMFYLNPFYKLASRYYASMGNPRLNPMYTSQFELAWNPYATVYYSESRGKIQMIAINRPDGQIVYTYANLSMVRTIGADITLQFAPWGLSFISYPSWWRMANVSLSYQHGIEKGSSAYLGTTEQWNLTNDSWRINSYISVLPGYEFDLTVSYRLLPKRSDQQSIVYTTSVLSTTVHRNFLDNKLSISLSFNDILNGSTYKKWQYGSSYSNYSESITKNSRNVSLYISWSFNNFKFHETQDISDHRD